MGSIKNLKKDIDLLMSLVLNDCFYIMEYNQKVDNQAILKIAEEIISKHREFRVRINNPEGVNDAKQVKNYYGNLSKEALETANDALENLSKEVRKVAQE